VPAVLGAHDHEFVIRSIVHRNEYVAMSRLLRGGLLTAVLGFSVALAGCAEDNEKTAELKGTNSPTPTDYSSQSRGGKEAMKKEGYPGSGAGKKVAPKAAEPAPAPDAK